MDISDFICPACGHPGEYELRGTAPVRYITLMYKDGDLLMEQQDDNPPISMVVGDWYCRACGYKIIRGSKYAFTEHMLKRIKPGGNNE